MPSTLPVFLVRIVCVDSVLHVGHTPQRHTETHLTHVFTHVRPHIAQTNRGRKYGRAGIWIHSIRDYRSIRSAQEPRQSSMSAETGGPSELRIVRCVAATARGVSSRVHSATHDTHPVQQQHQNVTPPTTLPRTSTVEGASQLQNPGLTRGSM